MGGVHQLVSRGVELAYQNAESGEAFNLDVPGWMLACFGIFLMAQLFVHLNITYTLGLLVPVLTMVEAPSATAVIRTQTYHDDESPDAPLLSKEEKESQKPQVDEEVMVITNKPITSRLRGLLLHLRQETGSKHASWRGVGGFMVYNIATAWAVGFAKAIIPLRICSHLLHIPVAGALCLLSTAWIQQLVAKPGKNYFQRVSELSRAGAFRKLVIPVMAVEIVETAVFMLPAQLSVLFGGFATNTKDDQSTATIMAISLAVAALVMIFSIIFVVIPLNIGLIRLQASLLSEESETVVPLDRTLNGAEKKNIKAAWRSFTREGCRLLAKNYIKYFMVSLAWGLWTVLLISVQLYAFFGSDAIKVVRKHAEEAQHMML